MLIYMKGYRPRRCDVMLKPVCLTDLALGVSCAWPPAMSGMTPPPIVAIHSILHLSTPLISLEMPKQLVFVPMRLNAVRLSHKSPSKERTNPETRGQAV